jgi:hypothetical protein
MERGKKKLETLEFSCLVGFLTMEYTLIFSSVVYLALVFHSSGPFLLNSLALA